LASARNPLVQAVVPRTNTRRDLNPRPSGHEIEGGSQLEAIRLY
jgi:hypothetical protein